MESVFVQAAFVVAAVAAVALSPFGRATLRSVREDGLTFAHARHLVRTMLLVALLVIAGALLNLHGG